MDSYQSSKSMPALANQSCTQIEFSSYHLSKSISARKPRWISPSPKKSTMTQIITSKHNEVKNSSSRTTKSFEGNYLKRKSSVLSDIDNKIKRLEALQEETTTVTSDSDTTITKIDSVSKKRKLSEFGDLCKPLKIVENTVKRSTLLQPFTREEDLKIIMHFHKYMELLSRKEDLYTYQLLEMKYRFQRSAKFLRDRFLTEILPNLYVYDCLSLDELVIFYDKADMLVPTHVQNMIREKFRRTTGHDIPSPETAVITIIDSDNEETDPIVIENGTSSSSSVSSSIIPYVNGCKKRKKVLKLSSSSISSKNNSETAADNSSRDSCNNTEVPCVVSSVTKELTSLNISSVCDSASHISIDTCQLVQDSDQSKCISVDEENICHTNVVEGNNKDQSYSVDRDKQMENIKNTCDTEEKSSESVPLSPCLFESSEEDTTCEKVSDNILSSAGVPNTTCETAKTQNTNSVINCNNQSVEHEELVQPCVTKVSDNCVTNKDIESSPTMQNDQLYDNSVEHSDHTYVKVNEATDNSPDNDNERESDSSQSSTFSADTKLLDQAEQCTNIKNKKYFAKATQTNSEQLVKSISEKSTKDESTNTEFPVNAEATQTDTSEPAVQSVSDKTFRDASTITDFTRNTRTQIATLGTNNIDRILCTDLDVIELTISGETYIFISQDVDDCNIKEITEEYYDICNTFVHFIDNKKFETLKVYSKYRNNIDTAILQMAEKEINVSSTQKNSGYNLRRFVKDPRSGTLIGRKIQWFKKKDDVTKIKRNVEKSKTESDNQSIAVSAKLTPARRTQQINKLFGVKRRKHSKAKSRKQIKKVTCLSAVSAERNESTGTSTPDSCTSTRVDNNKNADDENCKKHKPVSLVVNKKCVKENQTSESDNQIIKSTSESDNQISKSTSESEESTQSVSSGTSTSSVSNKSVPPSSNKASVSDHNKNSSVTVPENSSTNPICDVKKDNPEHKCDKPESSNQNNKSTSLITEHSNESTAAIEENQINIIASIKSNFEKRVYKKLESFYPLRKYYSSRITEQSAQSTTSPPVTNKQVFVKINKNTGNILELWSVSQSTDKKIMSNSKETSDAMSVTENVQKKSESTNLNTAVSDSNNPINTHINEQVSEEMISSSDSSATDLASVHDSESSCNDTPPVQKSKRIREKMNDQDPINIHINEQVSEKMISSSDSSATDLASVHDSESSCNNTLPVQKSKRIREKMNDQDPINIHINEQVSEKMISSSDSRATDLASVHDSESSCNDTPPVQKSKRIREKMNDQDPINIHINEQVSEKMISSSDSRATDLPSDHDSESSCNETPLARKSNRIQGKNNGIYESTNTEITIPGQTERTDELSLIKPKRTYTRKASLEKQPDTSCAVSIKTEPDDTLLHIKLELSDLSNDSGLEMITSQLHLESPVANTSCAQTQCSSASDNAIVIEDEPNYILDFLIDGIKVETEDTSNVPAHIPEPIYETVPVNRDEVNLTMNNSLSSSSETDSVWCKIKRIMSSITVDDSLRVLVKSQNTQTDNNTTMNEHDSVQVKQELITRSEVIKQELIAENDSCDNYPEMSFDCAQIKQELSILESNNTVTSPYFTSDNIEPILPVNLPTENVQTHLNMSKRLKALVTENRLSINHLKPVSNAEIISKQELKTEHSTENE